MTQADTIAISVAIISLVSSAIVVVLTFIFNNKTNEKLEKLRSRLAGEKSEQDARRDYEFDARKRLYAVYEPHLFQLNELSESAYRRIMASIKHS